MRFSLGGVPEIDWVLAFAVLVSALFALPTARRGGRFRGLTGWVGFWVIFSALLLALAHAPRWFSFSALGLLMFAALRGYFFVAPVRMQDRYAVLATYATIPVALLPASIGHVDTFLATVPVALFLFIPVLLALGPVHEGMLDSMGRTLLGAVFFVFCMAHLGLIVYVQPEALPGRHTAGLVQFFGILVLAAELPRRLAGDFVAGERWSRPIAGVAVGLALAATLGWVCGPMCGMVREDGARAGGLVLAAVTLGARVSAAVARDLSLSASSALLGRGALLNRLVPAVYAAPVYFHYLSHFA